MSAPDPRDMRGAGVAAALAFFQVFLVGYVAYFAWFLLRHRGDGPLILNEAVPELFFPGFLGLFLFLPTDALTRATAKAGAAAGGVLLALVAGMALQDPAGNLRLPQPVADVVGGGWNRLGYFAAAVACAGLAAFAAGEAVRPFLRDFVVGPSSGKLRVFPGFLYVLVAPLVTAMTVLLRPPHEKLAGVFWMPSVLFVVVAVAGTGLLFQLAAMRHGHKTGIVGSLQVPLALLVAVAYLGTAHRLLWLLPAWRWFVVIHAVLLVAVGAWSWLQRRRRVKCLTA